MHCGRIDGATRMLGAPAGWDAEKDGYCGVLPVRDEQGAMASVWFPTPEEMLLIAAGAPVKLWVLGTSHPPVMLGVGNPPA